MKFDLTISLSIIIIFVTAISPVVVNYMNNKHQLAMKKLEHNLSIRNNIINDFIDAVLKWKSNIDLKYSFYRNFYRILPYATSKTALHSLEKLKSFVDEDTENATKFVDVELSRFIKNIDNLEPTKTNKLELIKNKINKLLMLKRR